MSKPKNNLLVLFYGGKTIIADEALYNTSYNRNRIIGQLSILHGVKVEGFETSHFVSTKAKQFHTMQDNGATLTLIGKNETVSDIPKHSVYFTEKGA